jgi:hypothetical protein
MADRFAHFGEPLRHGHRDRLLMFFTLAEKQSDERRRDQQPWH